MNSDLSDDREKRPDFDTSTVESILPQTLAEGEPIAVRTAGRGPRKEYVLAGRLESLTPIEECSEKDTFAIIAPSELWVIDDGEVSIDEQALEDLDRGAPKAYHRPDGPDPSEWEGARPSICTEETHLDLLLPSPAWSGSGLAYYVPIPLGEVVAIEAGPILDMTALLEPGEEPPTSHEVNL